MNIFSFETINVKSKSIVRFFSGFAFKNNFTFTIMEHLVWEEIKTVDFCGCCFLLTVSIGFLYLPLSGAYSKGN